MLILIFRLVNIEPLFTCMNSTHAFIADKSYVYLWQYRSNTSESSNSVEILKKKLMKEIMFFIEDNPSLNDNYKVDSFNPTKVATDPISAIYSSENWLVVTCASGKGYRYQLPHITNGERLQVGPKFTKIGLNKSGQYLWGIDEGNNFTIWDLDKFATVDRKKVRGNKLEFEKKDVWNVAWSNDNLMHYSFMEKNKLNIMKDSEVEDQVVFNGYLAEFTNYSITGINLEELMAKPNENHTVSDIIVKFESRCLKDLKEMIKSKVPLSDIYKYVEKFPHETLWAILAQHALLQLDFGTAEKCMIQFNDYIGLSFIKRLKCIDDDMLKKAETHTFYGEYDKAEEIYAHMERKDLIITMRIKLGHWDKVISFVKDSGFVQEDNLKVAYNNLGMQFLENNEYEKAEELFKITNNHEGLVNIWFRTENFDKAAKFVDMIPEQTDFLMFMGDKFETVSF